jgi:hypothetical protein
MLSAVPSSLALLIISSLQDAPHLPSIPDRDELKPLQAAAKRRACNDASSGLVGFCCDWPVDWMRGGAPVGQKGWCSDFSQYLKVLNVHCSLLKQNVIFVWIYRGARNSWKTCTWTRTAFTQPPYMTCIPVAHRFLQIWFGPNNNIIAREWRSCLSSEQGGRSGRSR